jgi:hypothetical protein
MKFSTKAQNTIKAKKQQGQVHVKPAAVPTGWWLPPRWALLVLCMVLAGGGTWALFEFVIWNTMPSELVGRWEVVQGPREYRDATFEFFWFGSMEGRINHDDNLHLVQARVKVVGDKIYSTTRHPRTGAELTQIQHILTLTATELVVEDEKGEQLKMRRAR